MSNSLDSDQTGQNVRPDLGPNYLQRLSAAMSHGASLYFYHKRIISKFNKTNIIPGIHLNLSNWLENKYCKTNKSAFVFADH